MSNTARHTSMTYPNGRVVNLGYGSSDSIDDLFSLVKSAAISGESGNKVEYSRAGLGRFVKISYLQPGVELSMIRPGGGSMGDSGDLYDGYDRFGRVQEMRWQSSSTGTPIDALQWGYNEASNRTWKKNLVAASGQDEAYGYDGLYQVIRDAVGTLNTNRTAIGGIPVEEEDFTYDPTGNWRGYRKHDDGSIVLDQTRSNNKDNELTQIDGSSALLAYDRAGNATKVPPGTGGNWSKYYQPVWDAWGRLVEVKDETGTPVQKNAYDGLTRRITKEAASVVTHTYWSDQWKPVEERIDTATTAARSYLWGKRTGHRDELIIRDRDTDGNGSLDERLYATMDYFNGTGVLNASGTVLERYSYSAFGARLTLAADFTPQSTSSYAWNFGFKGQFCDDETGWYNYGLRFYVPILGRWINRDPIGESGGTNLLAAFNNDPTNLIDLYGAKLVNPTVGGLGLELILNFILVEVERALRECDQNHLCKEPCRDCCNNAGLVGRFAILGVTVTAMLACAAAAGSAAISGPLAILIMVACGAGLNAIAQLALENLEADEDDCRSDCDQLPTIEYPDCCEE
jgi:RHS repeat-associated protein